MCRDGYPGRLGFYRVRRVVGLVIVTLVAAGCRDATVYPVPQQPDAQLRIRESPSPLTQVSVGAVRTMIPDRWRARPADELSRVEHGVVASTRPGTWLPSHTGREGMAALWVDGTEVGVPSDYYYLAATGPALAGLTHSPGCDRVRHRVFVDHRPAFAKGTPDSPGDYVAMGQGVCTSHDPSTRFGYFVAAPGYGPVRTLGIPSSSLYVVVAVVHEGPRAGKLIDKLMLRTRFGDATVGDLIAVAKAATI
jgi:hypothetical protein